jgi:hypothetical protein
LPLAAASDDRLDLGGSDGGGGRVTVLDPPDPPDRPIQPDTSVIDLTLVMLPPAVWRAQTHRVTDHRRIMVLIFAGALVVAGLFSWCPGAPCTACFSGRKGRFRAARWSLSMVAVRIT